MDYNGGRPYESGHALEGVSCSVKTCMYNHSGNACTANRIRVSNPDSITQTDTFCDTFSKK